jgi:GR25 family glycosyltransferase involved in LPS biosynthesis
MVLVKYINLHRRFDRRASLIRAFQDIKDIRLERFNAIDTNNPHGCAMSHKKILEEHDFSRDPILIIAEDDALPTEYMKNFSEIIKWMETNIDEWDIVSFGSSEVDKETIVPINDNLVISGRILCAHFVAYNSNIKKHIGNFNPNSCEAYKPEYAYDRWMGTLPVKKLLAHPFLVIQRESYSDLAHTKQNFIEMFNKASDIIQEVRNL